jgi:hypothetical protein
VTISGSFEFMLLMSIMHLFDFFLASHLLVFQFQNYKKKMYIVISLDTHTHTHTHRYP